MAGPVDKRKPATIIAELRRHLKDSHEVGMRSRNSEIEFERRAHAAEREALAWKKRYDDLLARIPFAPLPKVEE